MAVTPHSKGVCADGTAKVSSNRVKVADNPGDAMKGLDLQPSLSSRNGRTSLRYFLPKPPNTVFQKNPFWKAKKRAEAMPISTPTAVAK